MTDVFSKEKRSEVMSHIRGSGNKATELAFIKLMKKFEIKGWRRNEKIFGKPDFTFRKEKVVVFIDGCFWHCCPLHMNFPKNNQEFWERKIKTNVERDKFVSTKLTEKGWCVIRIWEHEFNDPEKIISELRKALHNFGST